MRVVEIVEAAKVRLTTGAVMVSDVQIAVHCGLSIRQARLGERRWLQVGDEETHAESIDALASRAGMGEDDWKGRCVSGWPERMYGADGRGYRVPDGGVWPGVGWQSGTR